MPAQPPSAAHTRWYQRPRMVPVVLIALAVLIRIVYFIQVSPTSFALMEQWPQSDMHYYDTWASNIARGDLLSTTAFIPEHTWHRDVAAAYFTEHPAARPNSVARVWEGWLRPPRFYQDALYPYLLAGTKLIFGPDVRWAFAWQLLLGVGSTLLIWDLSRRYFGDAVGVVAGAIALLTAPLVYYELVLLRESSLVFAGLAITWLAGLAFRRDDYPSVFVLGTAVGIGALLKGSLLIYAIALVAAIMIRHRSQRARGAWAAAVLVAGVLAGMAPLVARNLAVGVPPFSLASSGQLTFVAANEPSARPNAGNYINTVTMARFLGDTDGGWLAAVTTALKDHSAVSYLRLIGEKAYWAWHWYELPNNDNFYYRRMRIPVLEWLPITAWLICPLALAGLVLGLPLARRAWPLYLHVILSLIPLLVFYVLGRFRVGLLAAAIPFAALAVVGLASAVRERRPGRLLGLCAGVAVVMFWTSRPLDPGMRLIRTDDWLLPYSARYQPRLVSAVERGDFQNAALICEESFTELPTADELRDVADSILVSTLVDMRRGCAALWSRAGNPSRAQAQAQLADRIR